MKLFTMFMWALLYVTQSVAAGTPLDVKPSDAVTVNVDPQTVVRPAFPDKLFGFNINYRPFQEQLWDDHAGRVYKQVGNYLGEFPGAIYRYPGGLVADGFDWTNAIGPEDRRAPQRTVFNMPPAKIMFGIDEYLAMLKQVNGSFWYVLNLVGTDPLDPKKEADENQVAASNGRLSRYMLDRVPDQTRYYQLGNELDRDGYEWPVDKYVSRARKTIDAIHSVDKDAQFVAFLRDFVWTYKKDKNRGVSRPEQFMGDVLKGLPEIHDYSLHHYYCGKREDGKSRDVTFWLKQVTASIRTYRSTRGDDPSIWITEHSRQMSSDQPAKDLTVQYSSNLGGALCTADYLIAIAQVPQVKGAVWHGLNAGPWQLFDASVHYNDLRPRPVYWALRVLRGMDLPIVLQTVTSSPNRSGSSGGYDVRAVAFSNETREKLGLWLVNYYTRPVSARIIYKPLASQTVDVKHSFVEGQEGRDPDDLNVPPDQTLQTQETRAKVTQEGVLTLTLPPASVSSFTVTSVK